jgi:branched-chain amino acid transport system ATP-binding protein
MTLIENLLVGQHSRLAGNVFTDVARAPVLVSERLASERGHEVLRLLGLDGYAEKRAADLPFGVQKLAGVARALAMGPALLLLDEPAAGLSRGEAEELGALIMRLKDELGLTVLLVEHNMRLVMSISDRVVVLDEGQKLAAGAPREVATDPRVVEAYLGEVAQTAVVQEVQEELARGS